MEGKRFTRRTWRDWVFDIFIYLATLALVLSTLYPFVYLIAMSVSDPSAVLRGEVTLFPIGFQLDAYGIFFQDSGIWRAYLNSVLYALLAAAVGLIVNSTCGYALSLEAFRWRKPAAIFFIFTMFFSGGLIPTYILISNMKMVDTIWPLVLPGAMSVWYILIFRTFFNNDISPSLRESALLDGASEIQVFLKIVLPLSKPVIATIAMYYIVGQWNSYFTPMIYLNSESRFPLQILLQHKLTVSYTMKNDINMTMANYNKIPVESQKAAAILASVAPILCVYPFIQQYFVKGVMIGAVKG